MAKLTMSDATAIDIMGKMADRAMGLYATYEVKNVKRRYILLDLQACHFHACRLDLDAMIRASNYDFMHDIMGINRHLDRDTLKLKDCFLPRFAVLDKELV